MWKVAPWKQGFRNTFVLSAGCPGRTLLLKPAWLSRQKVLSVRIMVTKASPCCRGHTVGLSGKKKVIFVSCKVKQGRGKRELLSPSAQECLRHPLCSALLHLVAKQQMPQMTRVNRESVKLRMLQWILNVKCGGISVSWCQEIRTEKRWRSDKTQYATIETVGLQLAVAVIVEQDFDYL